MSDGRWPANVIMDPAAAALLDEQSGYQRDGTDVRNKGVPSTGVTGWGAKPVGTPDQTYGSGGGASRFFGVFDYAPDELEWIYSVGLTPYGTETP